MLAQDAEERVRNSLLGEVETEIVGMEHHKARLHPGEQVNLDRESENAHDRFAVRVENGRFEPVGYLPKKMASWLAPLIDDGKVHLDGYVPQCHPEVCDQSSSRWPLVLSVFQCENGHGLLDKAEPKNELDALHQTVLQAYQNAQGYRNPELILGLAKGLQTLESQELLPETRLLLALLPAMAREARMSQGMRATVRFRELLGTLVIGEPSHHHNLTFFPLLWPETHKPSYTLLSKAIEKGLAVVEEVNESGSVPNLAVTNKAKRPLLIPEGEILMGAKQNRVINVTLLVAAGVKFILPVSCVEQGRWRYKSRHFESKFCAPPSLRHKKLKAVHRNRSEHGVAASDQGEVWNEVQACLSETAVRSETSSLTDAFEAAEEKLKEHCKRMVLPKGASGVLVGRHDRIIGMDLFDSPTTLKTLWSRLSDAYFFDALRDPAAAMPTPADHAQRFIERLGSAAKPRIPALALTDGLKNYVATADAKTKAELLRCDFVTIRDRILPYRKAPDDPAKAKKTTVRKLSGSPVEVVLSALWTTLGDFKRSAIELGVFAHEAIKSIHIESHLFKHDCDGESSEERKIKAVAYLGRLLGGVDRFIKEWIDTSRFRSDGQSIPIDSKLARPDLDCQSARTSEPFLQFSVTVHGEGWEKPVVRLFAWRLPEIQPYRVADELLQWGAEAISSAHGYCLPAYHVPYYEELMLAKDDEETRRVLLHCVHDEGDRICNLLDASDLDDHDPLVPATHKLAFEYDRFIQKAKTDGLHAALLDAMDGLRKAYEQAYGAYVRDPTCESSPLAALLFRSFLIIARRRAAEGERWMWEAHEASCAVTVLHPALLEMLQAHVHYLLTSFTTVAANELKSPGARAFRDLVWQGYVDLAAIQMPLSGLIKDQNRVLDTNVRGENLIHRIGAAEDAEASLTTRLLLRYDAFEEDDISDTELFRRSRESMLICRVLDDYRKLHPHANDGLSIAVYQNQEVQPLIAAVDEFLKGVYEYLQELYASRPDAMKTYAMTVTVFTESSDDSSVARWVGQWKERCEAAESQASLAHYRQTNLSIAHRIVSPEREYRQFTQLVTDGLQVDIAFLNEFIRAGTQGNDFELVGEYDVTSRTLKFPILEKSFCAFRDPGRRLQRARVLSNRQFRLTTCHAELMARLKSPETRQNTHHVVLGYGDYTPWQGVVDALHQRAEWLVCIDPNIDERLIAEKGQNTVETREIIGFGSGVGAHGEANFTISTEQFCLADVLYKLEAAIQELYSGWAPEMYQIVAKSILAESQRLSGLSLVRATGIGQYVRDFTAYSLTRKLLRAGSVSVAAKLRASFAGPGGQETREWMAISEGHGSRGRFDKRRYGNYAGLK